MRLSKDLFPLEVGGFGFGLVDLGHRAGQHVLSAIDVSVDHALHTLVAHDVAMNGYPVGVRPARQIGQFLFRPVGYALMAVGIERLDKSGAGLHSAVHRRRRWGVVIPGAKALPRRSSR